MGRICIVLSFLRKFDIENLKDSINLAYETQYLEGLASCQRKSMTKKRIPVRSFNSPKILNKPGEPIPLSQLLRAPHTELMDPADLHTCDFESDPEFMGRWARINSAELPLVFTRVAIDDVLMGFVREGTSPAEIIIDPRPTEAEIRVFLDDLYRGSRPPLYIYEIGRSDTPMFACSDDMAILAAYREFGTTQVPVAILGEPTEHSHAELIFGTVDAPDTLRLYLEKTRESGFLLDTTLKLSRLGTTAADVLNDDQSMLERTLDRLREIHRADSEIHYNHVVASTLVRAIRAIDSMRVLLERGRGETLLVIARSLYELATMFYIDWLSPERMGKILTDAAQIDKGEHQRSILDAVRQEWLKEGWTEKSADAATKGIKKQFELARNISERCKLSPLRMIHNDLYSLLSGFAHQDAAVAVDFTGDLSAELPPLAINNNTIIRDAKLACQTVRFATGLIAYCVQTDLGIHYQA